MYDNSCLYMIFVSLYTYLLSAFHYTEVSSKTCRILIWHTKNILVHTEYQTMWLLREKSWIYAYIIIVICHCNNDNNI